MGGGGVTPDTCLAFNRRCWTSDLPDSLLDRLGSRPEIEPHYWDMENLEWPIHGKAKPDLIIFDPPYFDKKAVEYAEKSISSLSKHEYLEFFENFFTRDYFLSMLIGEIFRIRLLLKKPMKILF